MMPRTPALSGFDCAVLGYLCRFCKGASAARSQAVIARDLMIIRVRELVTARDVRDSAARLSESEDLRIPLIGTSGCGCFVCVENRDVRIGYRNLYVRMRPQGRRVSRFKRKGREFLNGQRHFDFAAAEAGITPYLDRPLLVAQEVSQGPDTQPKGARNDHDA